MTGQVPHPLGLWTRWPMWITEAVFPVVTQLPAGSLALVYGQRTSRAFTDLSGDVILRGMGAVMIAGAVAVLVGIAANDPVWKVAGWGASTIGTLIYGLGVVFGLGLGGVIAGFGYLGISVWTLVQVSLTFRGANARARLGPVPRER